MRMALLILALSCGPAFCQSSPDAATSGANNAHPEQLIQRLKIAVNPNPVTVVAPTQACSIPLLNVVPAGTPVPMPNLMPPSHNPFSVNTGTPTQSPVDHMPIVAPAPACPSSERDPASKYAAAP